MPAGRPSSFKEEYVQQAERLAALGLTDIEMAEVFGVSVRTLHRWKVDSEEFCHALKAGKDHSDERIARSLYQRASGYEYTEQQAIKVKDGQHQEHVELVTVERHMPPDTTAGIFWLKNRRPLEWRDVKAQEISGPAGEKLTIQIVRHADDPAS
jgi:hypothetical protein